MSKLSGKKAIDPAWDFVHEDSTVMKLEDYPVNRVFSTKKPIYNYVVGINRPDRDYVTWVIVNATPAFSNDGNLDKIVANFLDITGLKRVEEALKESEEKCRSLITNIPDVAWTTDYEFRTSFISPNTENVIGYTPEEIYEGGNNIFPERIHPEDAEEVEKAFKKLFEKGTMFDVEYRIKTKGGEWIWLHDRSMSIYERNGVTYADGLFSNITNRKQAEEALRESEGNLQRHAHDLGERVKELNCPIWHLQPC